MPSRITWTPIATRNEFTSTSARRARADGKPGIRGAEGQEAAGGCHLPTNYVSRASKYPTIVYIYEHLTGQLQPLCAADRVRLQQVGVLRATATRC